MKKESSKFIFNEIYDKGKVCVVRDCIIVLYGENPETILDLPEWEERLVVYEYNNHSKQWTISFGEMSFNEEEIERYLDILKKANEMMEEEDEE